MMAFYASSVLVNPTEYCSLRPGLVSQVKKPWRLDLAELQLALEEAARRLRERTWRGDALPGSALHAEEELLRACRTYRTSAPQFARRKQSS
jgi:hypothetical protein